MSTMLFMERMPQERSLSTIHFGDGAILDVGHDSCAVTRAEFGVFHRNSQIIVHINAFSFYGRGLDDVRFVKRNGCFSCNASY